VQLWDGCVKNEDASLQLLLIVDLIFDWAREIYRPSILRLLKSALKAIEYDQVSLTNSSDIASTRQRIASWIPKPPTVSGTLETIQENMSALDHGSVISVTGSKTQHRMYAKRSFQTRANFEGPVSAEVLSDHGPNVFGSTGRRFKRAQWPIWKGFVGEFDLPNNVYVVTFSNNEAFSTTGLTTRKINEQRHKQHKNCSDKKAVSWWPTRMAGWTSKESR